MSEPGFVPVMPDSASYSQLTNYVEYVLYEESSAWEYWYDWAIEYGSSDQIAFAELGSENVIELKWDT